MSKNSHFGGADKARAAYVPLKFELLEDREVPATFTVSNLNDAGAGSLRQAIDDANTAVGADVVQFQAGLAGTIGLASGQLTVTDDLNIRGPGAATITVRGDNFNLTGDPVFRVDPGAAADVVGISGLTITGGVGGIFQITGVLNVADCIITDNFSLVSNGGGNGGILSGFSYLFPGNETTLNLLRTQVTKNRGTDLGGGVSVYGNFTIEDCTIEDNRTADRGAGVFAHLTAGKTGVIRNSTISANQHSAFYTTPGGGVFLEESENSSVLIENSTISNNMTRGNGGGVYAELIDTSSVAIRNSTIAQNIAGADGVGIGGGVMLANSAATGTLTMENSIVAGNTQNAGAPNDLIRDSGILDTRFDLIETAPSGGTINGTNIGNIVGADPLLGNLTNNGGPTLTHALLPGSPAINAGDPAFVPPPTTDQRGSPRVVDGRLDIGAVESPTPPVEQPICNPGDSENTCFVKRLYVDLLGRRVDNDEAGLKYIAELDAGRSRRSVADEIVHSSEYAARQIRALYQSVLGRDADETGLASYVADVTSGRFKLEQVQADLIASDEFRNAHPGDQLTPAILAAIPGGTPESDSDPLAGQDQARDFALDVLASNGAIDANLTTTYDTLLHRGLDDKAFDYRTLARNSSISSVLVEVAASDEYFNEHDETTLL